MAFPISGGQVGGQVELLTKATIVPTINNTHSNTNKKRPKSYLSLNSLFLNLIPYSLAIYLSLTPQALSLRSSTPNGPFFRTIFE